MKMSASFFHGWIALCLGVPSFLLAAPKAAEGIALTGEGRRLEARYTKELELLRLQLTKRIPYVAPPTTDEARKQQFNFPDVGLGGGKKGGNPSLDDLLDGGKKPNRKRTGPTLEEKFAPYLTNDRLDGLLVKYVILLDATPRGLAEFAQQDKEHLALVERLLANADLMKRMLVADGAKAKRIGRSGYGPARYGEAMKIYTAIRKASSHASGGVFERLALAISLEHAVPMTQTNPKAQANESATIDPIKRYLHYEKAYLAGELDPTFKNRSVWSLRRVVNGDAPDEVLAWAGKHFGTFGQITFTNPTLVGATLEL